VRLGNQHRYCPNCGKPLYDDCITMNRVALLMCDDDCRQEWELKFARTILGRSAEIESPEDYDGSQ
jgi:hypothetical protein